MARLIADVRGHERARFRFFFTLSALLGAAQVVGVAASESIFLARHGVQWLPHTFVAASFATVFFSWLYASVVGRVRNDWIFWRMLFTAAAILLVAAAGLRAGWPALAPALVCLYWVNYAVFLNHFWTFASDYFDTVSSKRLFPLFTVGASLGSIAGGAVTALAGRLLPAEVLVVLWGGCLVSAGVLLRTHRRRLRRWGPLALQESDDTSLEGIAGAMRVARGTPLGRRLALSALAMVLSLFVLQYLYSDVFVRSFPTAGELAFFFGVYLFVTNLVEVAVELWVTPALIGRFGVAGAHVVHPLLTVLSFAALAVDYRLPAAVAARANRELLENAMAGPVRNLVYNALPAGVRGPTRAFLEGMVVYSGMAVAGLLLLLLAGRLDPLWLCAAGGATALLYLAANLGVRRQYLRTLVAELRAGRLDLDSLSGELSAWQLGRLASLWRGMLQAHDAHAAAFAPQLAPRLAAHGEVAALRAGLDHGDPRVRRACVSALGTVHGLGSEEALLLALEDGHPRVRLVAVETLPEPGAGTVRAALERRLADPAPRVRAAAASRLGEAGHATLRDMLGAPDVARVRAALAFLPAALLECALPLVDHADPRIQAAALRAAVRLARPVPLARARLEKLAEHPSADVRRATVAALATRAGEGTLATLAGHLADPARAVRDAAAEALAALGDAGVEAARPCLRAQTAGAVRAAIRTLAEARTPTAERLLDEELAYRVRQAWWCLGALQRLPHPARPGRAAAFLVAALADALARHWRLAFEVLHHTEDRVVMRSVEKVLRFETARARGDALEVLSNLGDRETARLLVLMAEAGPVEEKLRVAAESVVLPADGAAALEAARRLPDRWVRMAFELDDAPPECRAALEDDMEKLLALKQIPLFAPFDLEQLEALSRVARETTRSPGDPIVREGDAGGDLYVVLSGTVRVVKNHGTPDALHLGDLGPGSYFGEMAIFDERPRSATVIANEPTRVLVLAGDRLKELVVQSPEIAFQIFEVLTTRIREVERRLDRMSRERGRPAGDA